MIEHCSDEQHLTYDELLKALARMDDQSQDCRRHLADCSACQQALARVEQRYTRIGQMAGNMAPTPSQPFRLPRKQTVSRWRMKPLMAMGAVAVLIMMFFLWQPLLDGTPGALPKMAMQQLEEDRVLMQEINALVENALPPAYRNLTAFSRPIFDEDLINRIVPSIEEDDNSLT
jgi:hypothetical protein